MCKVENEKKRRNNDDHDGDSQRRKIAKLETQIKTQKHHISSIYGTVDTSNSDNKGYGTATLPPPTRENPLKPSTGFT